MPRLLRNVHVHCIWEGTTSVMALDVLRALRHRRGRGVPGGRRGPGPRVRPPADRRRVAGGPAGARGRSAAAGRAHQSEARRLAWGMARTYQAALLCEAAGWALDKHGDRRTATAAALFTAEPLVPARAPRSRTSPTSPRWRSTRGETRARAAGAALAAAHGPAPGRVRRRPAARRAGEDLAVTSTAFAAGEAIPAQYTCDGEEVSPPWCGPAGPRRHGRVRDGHVRSRRAGRGLHPLGPVRPAPPPSPSLDEGVGRGGRGQVGRTPPARPPTGAVPARGGRAPPLPVHGVRAVAAAVIEAGGARPTRTSAAEIDDAAAWPRERWRASTAAEPSRLVPEVRAEEVDRAVPGELGGTRGRGPRARR